MNIWKTKDELSKHGRNGDTMTKKIDGDLAHVNPVEYEMSPEYIKEKGAGTINPITGKKEYWVPLAMAAVSGAMKIGSIISGNKKKKAAREAALQLGQEKLAIAQEERDLQLEASGQTSRSGQTSLGLQTTAATSDIYSQESTGTKTMATSGTSINLQQEAIGGVTAKAQSDVQNLVASRALQAEKTNLGYEKTEMGIEQQYQNMLSANQQTGLLEGVGQVTGAAISGYSTGMSVAGAFAPQEEV